MSTQRRRIYLDHNATAPLAPAARAAISALLDDLGNPSSTHAEGRRARDRVEAARREVAALAGCPREEIVFTSGGTEANQLGVLALAAAAERDGRPRVVAVSPIEHPCVRGAVDALVARGWTARRLPVTADGRLVLDEATAAGGLGVVAVAAVNHELGTAVDVAAVAAWARAAGAALHLDAVQAAGKVDLAPLVARADAVALSGHKVGAPAGVGALRLAAARDTLPLVAAGHQERGRRPGTENVMGIAGFGAACGAARAAVAAGAWGAVTQLGERLEAGLRALPGARIHGAGAPRVGGTVNAGFAGARGDSVVAALDLAGVAASTGAACASGSPRPSEVLLGLGLPPASAREAVRFSLGLGTTAEEIDEVLALLPAIVDRARRFG